MNIELRKIDEHNWREVIALEVHKHQENFVASNLQSLAECYVNPGGCEHHPLAIYDDGKAVGFALYVRDDEDSRVQWIKRFMIDKNHQRHGLGRAALVKLINLIRELEGCREINLMVVPENKAAQNFYQGLGFIDTEQMHEGEMIFSLALR
ncbi:MAG TPA: GNAT family N-acetyltransferase [Pyrinomonadaceae bacterium]|jgi:diamine N-acetyltransferase|nr:GNAT family N-acetyltransferase [Pyrinomonadaceae bacterium]